MISRTALASMLVVMAGPTMAQVQANIDQNSYPIVMPSSTVASSSINTQGQTAAIGDARVGDRQTSMGGSPGLRPLNRIQSRIVSRIDSRLRTRIDRNYDPDASTRPLSGITMATEADRGGRSR